MEMELLGFGEQFADESRDLDLDVNECGVFGTPVSLLVDDEKRDKHVDDCVLVQVAVDHCPQNVQGVHQDILVEVFWMFEHFETVFIAVDDVAFGQVLFSREE